MPNRCHDVDCMAAQSADRTAAQAESPIRFFYDKRFPKRWNKAGGDFETDYALLCISVESDPKANPIIPGMGGLRKLRFPRPRSNKGKSDGLRALYDYDEPLREIFWADVYPANKKGEFSRRSSSVRDEAMARRQLKIARASVA
jgi:hypothetical protein